MGSNWKVRKLEDIAQVIDSRHKTPQYSNEGYPMVRVVDVKGGLLQLDGTKRVNEAVYTDFSKGRDPEVGDLIISRVGSYGNVAYVNSTDKFCLGQNTASIIPNDKNRFLYYALTSPQIKAQIEQMVVGAVQKTISLKTIKILDIPEPPREIKDFISKSLGAIDDKIELNQQTNKTLEQMAQTLFKSWFVDFDPVFDNLLAKVDFKLENLESTLPEELVKKAKIRLVALNGLAQAEQTKASLKALSQGLTPESPEILPQHATTHAHFPNEFEHNEQLGWIPKGWEFGQIATHAHVEMGQSPKGDTYNDNGIGTPLVNGPVEFGPYFTKKSKWTTAPTKLSKKGDLIVCVRGSTTGRFVKSDGEYCLGRGVCSIRGKKHQVFTYQLFKHSIREMLGLTTGSTFPNWSRQTLSEFKSIVPSDKVLQIFEGLVTPKINKVEAGVIESESLTKLRDTLLPKLISGELQIPEADL
ncbi:restriction endonuclease subunit S [Pseudocolwellia agarivorans]|uniref:restriction endonuclease subunit S n=1 Tax=Pseudocolwellia agarivorans TaxID=1911682 RepID=UPI003F8822A1